MYIILLFCLEEWSFYDTITIIRYEPEESKEEPDDDYFDEEDEANNQWENEEEYIKVMNRRRNRWNK